MGIINSKQPRSKRKIAFSTVIAAIIIINIIAGALIFLDIQVIKSPEMTIEKPVNGLYIFNSKLLPLSRTIIIGPIDIEITGSSDITKAEFYIDNKLIKTDTSSTPEWYMNIKLRGKHNLEIIVYDGAGNSDSVSQMITVYNFFGK